MHISASFLKGHSKLLVHFLGIWGRRHSSDHGRGKSLQMIDYPATDSGKYQIEPSKPWGLPILKTTIHSVSPNCNQNSTSGMRCSHLGFVVRISPFLTSPHLSLSTCSQLCPSNKISLSENGHSLQMKCYTHHSGTGKSENIMALASFKRKRRERREGRWEGGKDGGNSD